MTSYRTIDFLAPSLHPNTLVSISLPEPGPSRDPVVRNLPIKHGVHAPLGTIKRLLNTIEGLVVADDAYRVSTLTLPTIDEGVPEVVAQHAVTSRQGAIWTGLIGLQSAAISSLSTGRVTLHQTGGESTGMRVGGPVLTLSNPEVDGSSQFALAGKEVEISLWDAERAFAPRPGSDAIAAGKRKKDTLLPGEIWRAKNIAHNNLSLRQPVHHLTSTFLPRSTSDIVTGTKSGSVRRYDTRQRKPVADWKIAREGGVGCVVPGAAEHELFFADHSSLVGSLDLRTGRLLYIIPSLSSTAHHMLTLPEPVPAFSQVAGLASISSDATLRLYGTTPPPSEPLKGNWGNGTKKGCMISNVGAVGVGSFVFTGFGSRTEVVEALPNAKKAEVDGESDEDEGDEEVDENEEEEIWHGMGAVQDARAEDDDDSETDSDAESDVVVIKRVKRQRN